MPSRVVPRLLSVALYLAVLAACAGPPTSPSPGVPFPLYPMALVFTSGHEAGEPVGELRADGTIVAKQRGVIGRLLPDRVLGPDGKPQVVAMPNGDVRLDPSVPAMRFDARDALVSSRGEAIWVDDAGVPTWTEPHGDLPALLVRFTPFNPAARRTAEVLLVLIMEAMWSRGMT